MKIIFGMVLQNSMVGSVFIAVILLVRRMTRNMQKIYMRILWLLLLVVLLLPPIADTPFFSARSVLERNGIFTAAGHGNVTVMAGKGESDKTSYAGKGADAGSIYGTGNADSDSSYMTDRTSMDSLYSAERPGMDSSYIAERPDYHIFSEAGKSDKQDSGTVGSVLVENISQSRLLRFLWITGVITIFMYYLEGIVKLQRKVKFAVKTERGVWEAEQVETPFVMPGFRTKIYLPAGLTGREREDILAHERQHIRYGDPWIKLVAAFALTVHWFNPLVWLACLLMSRDLEICCDEGVLKGKSFEEKKRYSQTLLNFSSRTNGFSLAMRFGESDTGTRISHILYAKKPRLAVKVLLVLLIGVCGIFFMTGGSKTTRAMEENQNMGKENGFGTETALSESDFSVGKLENPAEEENGYGSTSTEQENMSESEINPNEEEINPVGEETNPIAGETNPVVGEAYQPDGQRQKKIAEAVDYSGNWDYRMGEYAELPEDAVILIQGTENFRLYGEVDAGMLVEITEGSYVRTDHGYTSPQWHQPEVCEADYDADGETELAIIAHTGTGTGVFIDALYMVDRDAQGEWKMYEFLYEDYMPQLGSHFSTAYIRTGDGGTIDYVPQPESHFSAEIKPDEVRLMLDGKIVGTTQLIEAERLENGYQYYAGNQIRFSFIEGKIWMRAELTGESEDTVFGMGDYPGHEIDAKVQYAGEGNYRMTEYSYSDSNLNGVLSSAVKAYFTGRDNEIKEYYAAEGFTVKYVGKRYSENEITILDISYPVEALDSEKTEAVVTVRLGESGSPEYLTIGLVYEENLNPGNDAGSVQKEWKITSWTMEK